MKKLLVFTIALLMTVLVQAVEKISFSTSYVNKMPVTNGIPKSPMRPPLVYIEDHTLTFSADHPDYLLIIKDEDGEEVYTTTVFSAETLVSLPSTLSGDYEIQLQMGNWLFTGWICL